MKRIDCVLEASERAEVARDARASIVRAYWYDLERPGVDDLVFVPGVDFGFEPEEVYPREEACEAIDVLNDEIAKLLRENRLVVEMWEGRGHPLGSELIVPSGVEGDPEAWLWRNLVWALEAKRDLRECKNCGNLFQVGQNIRVIYCSDNCKYNAGGRVSFKPTIKGLAARKGAP